MLRYKESNPLIRRYLHLAALNYWHQIIEGKTDKLRRILVHALGFSCIDQSKVDSFCHAVLDKYFDSRHWACLAKLAKKRPGLFPARHPQYACLELVSFWGRNGLPFLRAPPKLLTASIDVDVVYTFSRRQISSQKISVAMAQVDSRIKDALHAIKSARLAPIEHLLLSISC